MIKVISDCDPSVLGPTTESIEPIIRSVFRLNNITKGEISFIFGKDELLLELKKRFFNKNQFTDVIAFRLNDYGETKVEGEIYISLPRAKENAKLFNEPYEKEVARLIIHGCLHLLGYLDETDTEKKKMTKMEEVILDQVDWEQLMKKNE